MTSSLETISFAIQVGRRQELDQTQAIRDRAYRDFREAAYMRQDAVELRWAAEQDFRAVEIAWQKMEAREALTDRIRLGSAVTFLAAAVLFVAALMTRG